MTTYSGQKIAPETNQVFVFDSDPHGFHHVDFVRQGAIRDQAQGFMGHTYAIQVYPLPPLHPTEYYLTPQIDRLYWFAIDNPMLSFIILYTEDAVSQYNPYSPKKMAELFVIASVVTGIPDNIIFEGSFYRLVKEALADESL